MHLNSKMLIRKNYPIIIRIAVVHLQTVLWIESTQISGSCFVQLLLTKPCIHTDNRQTDSWFEFLPLSRPNACSVREFLLLTFDLPTWIVPWGFSGMKTATNRAMMTRIAPKANGGPGTTLCNNEQTLSYILSYDTDAFTYQFYIIIFQYIHVPEYWSVCSIYWHNIYMRNHYVVYVIK